MAGGYEKLAHLIKGGASVDSEVCLAMVVGISPLKIEIDKNRYSSDSFTFIKPKGLTFDIADNVTCFIKEKEIFILCKSEVVI